MYELRVLDYKTRLHVLFFFTAMSTVHSIKNPVSQSLEEVVHAFICKAESNQLFCEKGRRGFLWITKKAMLGTVETNAMWEGEILRRGSGEVEWTDWLDLTIGFTYPSKEDETLGFMIILSPSSHTRVFTVHV